MANFNFNSNRLTELEGKLRAFMDRGDDDDDDENDENDDHGGQARVLIGILKDACSLVRNADGVVPDFKIIVDRVDQLVNSAVDYAYNDGDLCDFMPSFAHSEAHPELDGNMVQAEEGELVLSNHELDMFKSLMTIMQKHAGDSFDPERGRKMLKGPTPWSESMKPHPLSTRLSRFRGDINVSATSDQPLANYIYQARCEITSDSTTAPIDLTMSANGTVLVCHGMGGYKNRAPALWFYFPTDTTDLPDDHHVRLGLSDVAYWTTTDEERKLIFAADRDRIKSFTWGLPSGKSRHDGLPTHTMDTGSYAGPLAVLSGGRLIRAGKGSVGVWNLDTLPTHGAKGKTRIGKKISLEDTWRDDLECIETSNGSPADTTIKLELSDLSAAVWHPHPSVEGNMILASNTRDSACYSCVGVDLEHGGKTVVKYIGHGASINSIATSPGDPNIFVSASDDGFARLFDIRHSLPILTLKAGHPSGGCPSAIMIHPDGIPTVFTGSDSQEHIKLWDIRARQVVYELSTGNNAVCGMTWDTAHNSLYAITECQYMDRLGSNFDYRRAKVPKHQDPEDGERDDELDPDDDELDPDDDELDPDDDELDPDDDGLDPEDDELDSEDEGYEGRCWPKRAHHGEDYFGYLFDAGEHRIYKFAFKENANDVVPHYGQAMLDSAQSYW